MPVKKIDTNERDISILRAHAVAAALFRARPAVIPGSRFVANDHARVAWYECCRALAMVVCTKEGVSISTFYDLCGVPD